MMWIKGGIQGSLFVFVFCIGLGATFSERFYLLHRPGQIVRSLFSMNVVMPLLAVMLSLMLELPPAMKIALVALAVSPVPPFLPSKQLKAGGDPNYVFGLLVTAVLFSIAFVPFSIGVITRVLGFDVSIPAGEIAKIVWVSVLIPLASGVVVKFLAPHFAHRYQAPLSKAAAIILVACFLPVLVVAWPAIAGTLGSGSAMLAILLFSVSGLVVGQMIGGPSPGHKTVLALATSARHPAVAIAIGHLGFPDQKTVPAVVVLILILNTVTSAFYLKLRRRNAAQPKLEERPRQAA